MEQEMNVGQKIKKAQSLYRELELAEYELKHLVNFGKAKVEYFIGNERVETNLRSLNADPYTTIKKGLELVIEDCKRELDKLIK